MAKLRSVWDYLFYASMAVLALWLILKVAGVINTPVWLEYGVPIGSAVLGLVTLFQSFNDKFISIFSQLSRMNARLDHHEKDLEILKKGLHVS